MIPFINYNGDLAEADFEYGYGDALKDGRVVRPVYFPRINGRMEWTAPDGVEYEATFDDRLARDLASQRLRTALAVEGEWMPAVLAQAHAQLMHLRARDPQAAGLVITMDQEHAKAIAGVLQARLGVMPTIATSDDPTASDKISRFANGIAPWIVAVRMVSEGVDIPRLRVGVYATNTVTELFFRQAVGRLVRWNAGLGRQAAYMFIPDDVRLRKFGGAIAEQRRHCLRKESRDDDDGAPREEGAEPPAKKTETERDLAEQLSLFAPISATALDEDGRPLETDGPRVYDAGADDDPNGEIPDLAPAGGAEDRNDGARVPLDLTPLGGQVPPPVADAVPGAAAKNSMLARRRQLREQNAAAVIDAVHLTGRTHLGDQRRAQSQGRHQAHQHRDAAPARTTARAGAHDAEGPLGEAEGLALQRPGGRRRCAAAVELTGRRRSMLRPASRPRSYSAVRVSDDPARVDARG